MERSGAARSRGPLGSPSASSNKLGCRRLPAPGHRRLTGYPVLLRGELTLDFPLPGPAYGGQRSQPCIGAYDGRRTRTSDHTSRSRRRRSPVPTLPGTHPCPHYLNVGSLIQQASSIATSKSPNNTHKPHPTAKYPPAYPPACAATVPVGAVDRPPSGLPSYAPPLP